MAPLPRRLPHLSHRPRQTCRPGSTQKARPLPRAPDGPAARRSPLRNPSKFHRRNHLRKRPGRNPLTPAILSSASHAWHRIIPMPVPRRSFLTAAAATLASAAAQTQRDWGNRQPVRYPDPDVISLDPRFDKYKVGNAAIEKLYTGCRWAEGPAWNAAGQYLVFSDIPNDRQMRYIHDDSRVTVFHQPAGYTNGNTFDFEGRLVSCSHAGRRVIRYEHDGSMTV